MDCAKKFYHKSVAPRGHPDRIEYKKTAEQLAGTGIDDAITARIAAGTPLPPQYAPYEGMAAAVLAAPGTKLTQVKLALDVNFKPCGFMEWDKAWVRAIYDLIVLNGDWGWLADWKNGKVWLDEDQLKLFAAVGFHTFPELEVVDTSYVWLHHGVTSDKRYYRRELPDLWNDLLPDVERLQVAYRNNHWPAAPKNGKKTCQWCEVNQVGKCAQAHGPYGRK